VLAGDRKYHIERGKSQGDIGDFWVKNMTLSSTTDVWPNTVSYRNGAVRITGVELTVRSDPGFIMSFQISGLEAGRASDIREGTVPGFDSADEKNTTGEIISWILALLGGIAAMLGVLIVVM